MTIPDHIDMLCEMEQGGQMRLGLTSVCGHLPGIDINICGTEGTLRVALEEDELTLYGATRSSRKMTEIRIPKKKQLHWRVEEEFIGAIRGTEAIRSRTSRPASNTWSGWTPSAPRCARARKYIRR